MQARDLAPTLDSSVKVVIAYDNLDIAKRAEAVYDRLARRLGQAFEFQQRLWRFDVLEEDSLRDQAVRDAAEADIVIVAMKEDADMPEAVRHWLESLLSRSTGATALVALLDRPDAAVQPYLEDVARRGGMDFFAHSAETSKPTKPRKSRRVPPLTLAPPLNPLAQN